MRFWYLSAICVLAALAVGFRLAGEASAGCRDHGAYGSYCSGACGIGGYGMVPGCCEYSPSCCDNIWDGYCQRKAHRGHYGYRPSYYGQAPCSPQQWTGTYGGFRQPANASPSEAYWTNQGTYQPAVID